MLGIDISETFDEGTSIGASFAKGFSEGFDFDAVSAKLMDGLGNLVSNAGKLLPGGKSADLSSVFSAVLLSKIASPFIGLGKGAINLGKAGKTVLGSGTGEMGLGAAMLVHLQWAPDFSESRQCWQSTSEQETWPVAHH